MWFPLPPRGRLKTAPPNTKPKSTYTPSIFPDLLRTSLLALRDSADAFPPLKSAVSGVVALWDIADRARHSKSDAHAIALRAKEILDVIADAVPDGSAIPEPMLVGINRFTVLLADVGRSMETIAVTGGVSRVLRLNRNERILQNIKSQLDDAYRDFMTASTLRVEVQQAKLALEHAQTHLDVKTVAEATSTLLIYMRICIFLAVP